MAGSGEKSKGILFSIYSYVTSFITWIILAFLVFLSVFSTCQVDHNEVTHFIKGSSITNILAAVACIILLFLIRRASFLKKFLNKLEADDNFRNIIKAGLIVAIGACALVYALKSTAVPVSDQRFVQEAAYHISRGDYRDLQAGGYLFIYPNQLGLVYFSVLFGTMFGFGNNIAFRIMNVLFLMLMNKRISDITSISCKTSKLPEVLVLILGLAFTPLQMYCTFVYGTIPGLCLGISAFYHALIFAKDTTTVNAILCALSIALSMMFKSNFLIFFIAIFIYSFVVLVTEKKAIHLLLIALLIVAYLAQAKLPLMLTKAVTGADAPTGASPYSWIAMGLQESGLAEGWYNGYNAETYKELGYDSELQATVAKENIRKRVQYFSSNKFDCFKFFSRKLASEWNDPTFEAYWINRATGSGSDSNLPPEDYVSRSMAIPGVIALDHLQVIILLGALILVVLMSRTDSSSLLLMLSFIGGFIFHLFWEAKPQYTITYFALLLPLCALGLHYLIDFVESVLSKNKSKQPSKIRLLVVISATIIPVVLFAVLYAGSVGKSLIGS